MIAWRLTSAGEDFGASDQQPWINPERVANQAQHDDGADAEPATSHRKAKAAAAHSAIFAATVLDIVAAAKIIIAHRGFP